MNTLDDVNERYGVGADDACLALSSSAFDLSVYDMFGVLGVGGRVVVPPSSVVSPPQPSAWLELVEREGVSVWNSVPAFVELLVGQAEHARARLPSCMRRVLMSGDWVPVGLASRLFALCDDASRLRVVSMGGATEAAVWSVEFELEASRALVGAVLACRCATRASTCTRRAPTARSS